MFRGNNFQMSMQNGQKLEILVQQNFQFRFHSWTSHTLPEVKVYSTRGILTTFNTPKHNYTGTSQQKNIHESLGHGTGIKINWASTKSFTIHTPHIPIPWNKYPPINHTSIPTSANNVILKKKSMCNGSPRTWEIDEAVVDIYVLMNVVVW